MIEILILGGVILTGLYIFLTWNHNYWQKMGVACDKPSALFGSFKDSCLMRRNRAAEMDDLYQKYPGEKVVGWYNLRRPGLLVRDPDLVHKILVTDFYSFRNNDLADAVTDDPLSRNIFVLKDDDWKRSRALITPAFSSGKIKAIYPEIMIIGKEFAEYLKRHPEELHIKDTMSRYTTEIIAKCAFGIEGNAFKEDNPQLHEVGKSIFQPSVKRNLVMMFMFFIPYLNKLLKLRFVPSDVEHFFHSVLKDIIVHRQKNNVERNDLIHYLIELKKKTIEVDKGNVKSDLITRAYTDNDVLAGCVMFFIEAYETSALLLTHILYQLALHKDVQDKLRAEIDEEMKKGELTYEQVNEMVYLNSVIQETNRLLPVVHFLFKQCTERYEMDIGHKKLTIEKGTGVTIPLYCLHTDPLYWEDPMTFKPERFSTKEDAQGAKAKGLFLPFGDGPRMCIGVRMSTTIIKVAIINILAKLEVLPSSKTPKKIEMDPLYFMTTHKGGIHLRFAERS